MPCYHGNLGGSRHLPFDMGVFNFLQRHLSVYEQSLGVARSVARFQLFGRLGQCRLCRLFSEHGICYVRRFGPYVGYGKHDVICHSKIPSPGHPVSRTVLCVVYDGSADVAAYSAHVPVYAAEYDKSFYIDDPVCNTGCSVLCFSDGPVY